MRRPALIAVGIGLAVLLLWFMLLFRPQTNSLDDARAREDAADEANSQLELRLSRLQAAQAREPELAARLERLRVAIPDDPALAQFILDANDAAQASGVQFLSISPTPPAADSSLGLSVVDLAIDVTGGYFQTLDYLNRLATLPRVVVLDSIDLAASGTGDGTLSVSLAARMFTTGLEPAPGVPTTTTTAPGATTTTSTP